MFTSLELKYPGSVILVLYNLQECARYKTKYHNDPPCEAHVGWLLTNKPSGSRARTDSYGSSPGDNSPPAAYSIPLFQHPSHSLLKTNGFQQQRYDKYRYHCLRSNDY